MARRQLSENWSEERLIEAIEHNRFAAFASLGRSPYASVHDEDEMLRVFTNIAVLSPLCGWILRARLPLNDIDRRINRAVDYFESLNLPVIWNTGPSTRPGDLAGRLLKHGFAPVFELAGMAVELDALPGRRPTPLEVEIQPVCDSENLERWADTFTTGFNVAGDVAGSVCQLFASLSYDPDIPWHLFLAELDGVPVATSAMYIGAGVAGIYFVATVPEARQRGIGSLATLVPLRKARDTGCRVAVLHASPMAVSMYRSLGFREYCRMGLLAWQPPG